MRPSNRPAALVALVCTVVVVAIDQLSKAWAVANLSVGPCTPDTCIDVFWTLRFRLHFNRGASFTTGTGLGPLFGVIAIVMSLFLFRTASRLPVSRRGAGRPLAALLGLVAGGAIGNLIDRIVRAESGPLSGAVVDFIDLQWWPIFNVADMAIVGGVITLILGQRWFGEMIGPEQALETEQEAHSHDV